jgi:D-alanyl-D-alanine carboxypeptidase
MAVIGRPLLLCLAVVLSSVTPLRAQSRTGDAALTLRLDSLVREAVRREPLAGVSVAVLRGGDTLLHRGYGYADLELQVPATTSTTYRIIGPPLAAVVMQQVERGKLSLDDDASHLMPDFPWQGRHVTVRQLMDASSGLADFHYLGDPYLAYIALPKAPDEVTALIAGRPFTHEPGASWQWTASGFHLAGVLVERIIGQPFEGYLRDSVFARGGLTRTFYCDDRAVTPGLARSYVAPAEGFRAAPLRSATMYRYLATTCATAMDAATLLRAMRDGRLMTAASWRTMSTAVGTAVDGGTHGTRGSRGVGLQSRTEEGHKWFGETGTFLSFSSAMLDFADDSLTVAVLTNTSTQAHDRLARNLGRAALGLPLIPPPPSRATAAAATTPVERTPLVGAERARYFGTYRTKFVNPTPQYRVYERTYRVFEDFGRLMIQPLGDEPIVLLHQEGDVFAGRLGRVTFTMENGRAAGIEIQSLGQLERGTLAPPSH